MDEKTESLRDLFMEVSDTGTVTESQAEDRGSLATDEGRVDERLRAVVERMSDRFAFETDLASEEYCRLVRGFYDGRTDENLGAELDRSETEVFRARLDLHLLREADREIADLDAVGELAGDEADAADVAEALGISAEQAERALAIRAASERSQRVNRLFATRFEEILTDADLSVRLTAGVEDDGLGEAAEDIETDVEF